MILSISGRKRSGKDLIGNIIQYLVDYNECNYTHPITEKDFEEWKFSKYPLHSKFKVVKFADKLKDIICLLIGCTREQLEDEDFKNTELREEWWQYGLIRKDFRKPILYPSNLEDIEKQLKVFENSTLYIFKPSPRYLLQFIGTDLLRNQLHPQVWVNATMANYKAMYITPVNMELESIGESQQISDYPNWIITDCRFPNECEAIKERKGILIRINRPSVESDDVHSSEVALNDYKGFDYIIQNDNSIEDLIQRVKDILIKEDII